MAKLDNLYCSNKHCSMHYNVFLKLFLPVSAGKEICQPHWPKLIQRQLYVTLVFVIFYFLPLVIISGTYLRIRRKLSADSFLASQMLSRQRSTVKVRLDQNRKALQLLTPVVVAFAILMLPINAIRLFVSFNPDLGARFTYLRLSS